MIYGNSIYRLCMEDTTIQDPVEILEMSANYQYDLAMIQSDLGIVNEAAGSVLVAIIKVIIKFLSKFSIVIGGLVAAAIAFIMKMNKDSSSTRKELEKDISEFKRKLDDDSRRNLVQQTEKFGKEILKIRNQAIEDVSDVHDDIEREQINDEYEKRVKTRQKNTYRSDRQFKAFNSVMSGTGEKLKNGEKINIKYKDWGALLENINLSTDAVIVLKAQASLLVQQYDDFKKKKIMNGSYYETTLKTAREKIQKHMILINDMVRGGKDNFFDKNFKATKLVTNNGGNQSEVLDKEAISKLADAIKSYRTKVEEKEFTFTFTTKMFTDDRFKEFDKEFDKEREVRSLGEQMSRFNSIVKKCTKESISVLESFLKRIEKDEQDKHTTATATLARLVNQSMNALAKISNVTVTEIGYCCSQYLVERRRVENKICSYSSDDGLIF